MRALFLFLVCSGAVCHAGRAEFTTAAPDSPARPSPVPAVALAFSPDGHSLLVNGRESVLIWSVSTNLPPVVLPCAVTKVTALAFHPSGRLLAVAGGVPGSIGRVQLFDWRTQTPLYDLAQGQDQINAIAFSPDGAKLAVAGGDLGVVIYSVRKNEGDLARTFALSGHAGTVLALGYSPDGLTLVSAGTDRSVKVWQAATGNPVRSFNHHTGLVHCLAFPPRQIADDSNRTGISRPPFCASGSDDFTVRVWQPTIGRMVRIVRHHAGPIFSVVYHRDGTKLFSAGQEGIIREIDAGSDAITQQWQAHADWVYSLALSPDGRILASGDWTGVVRLWNPETGQPLLTP